MLHKFVSIALLAVMLTTLGCSSNPASIATVIGTVTKVHDGDSIHITPSGKKRVVVRLAGIDAPELAQPSGIASRDKLRSLILGKSVKADCHKVDQYRRQVCVVFQNGTEINLEMVRSGLAWHYKRYQNEQSRKRQKEYAQAERKARLRTVGLWNSEHLEPWLFRVVN